MHKDYDVAIIGMGCIFPNSIGLKAFWSLLFNEEDAITEIPEDTHWSLKDYFDENPSTPDHTYCKRGGFIPKVSFDPARYGMPPNNLEATDTSQLLALFVAEMALSDAGYPPNSNFNLQRTNVILGVTGTQELVIPLGARLSHPIWKKALKDSGVPGEKAQEILQRMSDAHTKWQENSFPGLLGNVVAGRIANRLDLGGTNTVVDAACASSLSAVQTACLELITGKCDMSVTGGVDTLNDIFMHMCFSKTGVLSHTSDARPFSKDADGTVLGEGIGMLVLKRLKDAQRDKDRIYAVIRSIGTSSDGKTGGIYAPDSGGQLRALNAAYGESGIDPETVEMIEAHGTGTRVGDKIEFTALKRLIPKKDKKNQCAVGSVKSMIGHAKAAAGAAGLIKAALALHHKVIPATLKAQNPDPELGIEQTPFYLNDHARPWLKISGHPRRSGVSAFGFGGSNFHAVLEEYQEKKTHVSWDGTVQIAAFSADSMDELKEKILDFKSVMDECSQWDQKEKRDFLAWQASLLRKNFSSKSGFRLLFSIHESESPAEKTEKALKLLNDQPDADHGTEINQASSHHPSNNRFGNRSGIFFGSGNKTGRLGFLFPGQGSQYPGMGRNIFSIFPEAIDALELAKKAFSTAWKEKNNGLENHMFPPPEYAMDRKTAEENLRSTEVAQPAIGAVSMAMSKVLRRFGIVPESTCGHSFGELSALWAAGWMDDETFFALSVDRGKYMAKSSNNKKDRGRMIAVKAPLKDIESFIKDQKLDLILANRNSPDQGVLSGASDQIENALRACGKNGMKAVELPVAAAFHSKLVENAVKPFKKSVKEKSIIITDTPVFSNTTGEPYPDSPNKAKKLLSNQLINPVDFVHNIEAMYKTGITTFLEVGPKTVLSGLTRSILKGRDHAVLTMDAYSGRKNGIEDIACVLCQLSAMGFDVRLDKWEDPAEAPDKKIMRVPLTGANIKPRPQGLPPSPMMEMVNPESDSSLKQPLTMRHEPQTGRIQHNNHDEKRFKAQEILNPLSDRSMRVQLSPSSTFSNQPEKDHLTTKLNRSTSKGADMASNMHQENSIATQVNQQQIHREPNMGQQEIKTSQTPPMPSSSLIYNAMQMVQKGLDSMQALQESTARAHEKFLDTQAAASRTLQNMMDQTRFFAWNTISTVNGVNNHEITPQGIPVSGYDAPDALNHNTPTHHTNASLAAPCSNNAAAQPESPYPSPPSGHFDSPAQNIEDAGRPENNNTTTLLLETVSKLTGFPVEMLDLNMDIESDLGIDSIKRVEIVSELEKKLPQADALTPDNLGTLKTLKDICRALVPENASSQKDSFQTTRHSEDEDSSQSLQTPPKPDTETSGEHDVMAILLKTVSSLTGFPVEMLEPQMDIESDLGIDSIKRVEILSKLEQEIPSAASVSPDDMSRLKSLEDIAKHLDQEGNIPSEKKKSTHPEKQPSHETCTAQNAGIKKKVLRQVVSLKKVPIDQITSKNGSKVTISGGKKVYITKDSAGMGRHLQDEFKRNNIQALLVGMNEGLKKETDISDAAGLIIIADALQSKDRDTASAFLKKSFLLAQKFAPLLCASAADRGAFFSTISFMGGSFGFDGGEIIDPAQGGLAGLAKTAALEWNDVVCKALDMPPVQDHAFSLTKTLVSLMMTRGYVEIGLKNGQCLIPELIRQSCDLIDSKNDSKKMMAGTRDIFIITGGAKGVTAECAMAIAKTFAPVIILMGRSELLNKEPEWIQGIDSEPDIKRAVFQNYFKEKKPSPAELEKITRHLIGSREITANIEKMKSGGAEVKYVNCDIRDKTVLSGIINEVRGIYGSITGLIHGAGVLEDRLIADKNEEQFLKVFNTKVKGLENLIQLTKTDSLRYFILFSSVAARMGNTGQVDYAMANEVLNKTAQKYAQDHGACRVLSLNWGPWEGGMVTPLLKKEFKRRGIDLIPLQEGAACLIEEMLAEKNKDVEIILGAGLTADHPSDKPSRASDNLSYSSKPGQARKNISLGDMSSRANLKPLGDVSSRENLKPLKSNIKNHILSTFFTQPVGMGSCPVLKDHAIAGEPILPLAMMVEWFAHTAERANPGLVFSGLDDMRLLKGVKPGDEEITIQVKTGRCTTDKNGYICRVEMHSSDAGKIHQTPDSGQDSTIAVETKNKQKTQEACLHSSARVCLKETRPPSPAHMPSAHMKLKPCGLSPEKAYEKCLFHGPSLQGITAINGISDMGIEVTARPAPSPSEWMERPHRSAWTIDPLIIDSAFQASIIWCYETTGKVCLPSYMANLRVYSSISSSSHEIKIILTVNEKTHHAVKGYFTFIDIDTGKIIASITGFEAVMDASLLKKFKQKKNKKEDKTPLSPSNPHNMPLSHRDDRYLPVFDRDKILAFAIGKPSEAFGSPYEVFDSKREIARLPGPPYFFMDRVVSVEPRPWEMTSGGWIEAEFDMPDDGWYFDADRGNHLPFCILLEIALQPCGWLAAYAGSALTSKDRLYFRNLGGTAQIMTPVHRQMGTLTMRSCMTNVSKAGGLIIQDFDMEVLCKGKIIYKGHTNFGFFTKASLANQTGIKSPFIDYIPNYGELKKSLQFTFQDEPPFIPEDIKNREYRIETQSQTETKKESNKTLAEVKKTEQDCKNKNLPNKKLPSDQLKGMPSKALRMIDSIESYLPQGGRYGKGYIKGVKQVDPAEWFFKAHFFQDPVCPGSLGIESFIQLMRFHALKKWNYDPEKYDLTMGVHGHKWIYRGQIIPSNKNIEVHAHIKNMTQEETNRSISADGILTVDGLCIYQMENFMLNLIPR